MKPPKGRDPVAWKRDMDLWALTLAEQVVAACRRDDSKEAVRLMMLGGKPVLELVAQWTEELQEFLDRNRGHG